MFVELLGYVFFPVESIQNHEVMRLPIQIISQYKSSQNQPSYIQNVCEAFSKSNSILKFVTRLFTGCVSFKLIIFLNKNSLIPVNLLIPCKPNLEYGGKNMFIFCYFPGIQINFFCFQVYILV